MVLGARLMLRSPAAPTTRRSAIAAALCLVSAGVALRSSRSVDRVGERRR